MSVLKGNERVGFLCFVSLELLSFVQKFYIGSGIMCVLRDIYEENGCACIDRIREFSCSNRGGSCVSDRALVSVEYGF